MTTFLFLSVIVQTIVCRYDEIVKFYYFNFYYGYMYVCVLRYNSVVRTTHIRRIRILVFLAIIYSSVLFYLLDVCTYYQIV